MRNTNKCGKGGMKIMAVMLAVMILSTGLCGCGVLDAVGIGGAKKFEQLAENGDYQAAVDYYAEKIQGNAKKEAEAKEYLDTWSEEIGANYCDENGVVSDEYSIQLETLIQINARLYLTDTTELQYYASGVASYNDANYMDAVVCFSNVDSDFVSAQTAQNLRETASENYAKALSETAWGYIGSENYAQAIDLLSELPQAVRESDTFDAAFTAAMTGKFEAAAAELGNDYIALKKLFDAAEETPGIEISADMTTLLANAKTGYRDTMIASARDAMAQNEYGQALTLLDEALAVLENDETLLACKTECEAAQADYLLRTTPVDVTTLKPFESKYYGTQTRPQTDTFGKSYATSLEGRSALGDKGDGYGTYRIDGIYKTFTGTIYLTTSNYDATKSARPIRVYGDGEVLYETTIACGADSIPFSVDITGVRDLKIAMGNNGMCKTYIGDPVFTP